WLASKLPVYGDFSHLLPPNAPSVVQLHELEGRIQSLGGVMVVVESDDAETRGRATEALVHRLEKIDKTLVAQIAWQNRDTRRWIWDNRFLFAPLEDLKEAKQALADKIRQAKLRANPLYVGLEEPEEKADAANDERVDKLRKKLKEAEEKRDANPAFVSKDGKMQVVVVRAPFDSSAVDLSSRLVDLLAKAGHETEAEFPGAKVIATGDLYTALAEHRALLNGMLLAIVITVSLVAAGMLLFYRSLRGGSGVVLGVAGGPRGTFGVTKPTTRRPHPAAAVPSSILLGDGINFGIVLLARHLEERRKGVTGVPAIAAAIRGTLRGTGTAALTASIAYGSLILTDFKGFKHFGIIGGVGMVLCWLTAYTLIPAALAGLERTRSFGPRPEPALGRALVALLPKRFGWVVAASVAGTAVAATMTVIYLVRDPWEHSIRKLRSETAELDEARAMISRINVAFGN